MVRKISTTHRIINANYKHFIKSASYCSKILNRLNIVILIIYDVPNATGIVLELVKINPWRVLFSGGAKGLFLLILKRYEG